MAENVHLSINAIPKDRVSPKRNPQLLFGLALMFVPNFACFLLRKIKGLIALKASNTSLFYQILLKT